MSTVSGSSVDIAPKIKVCGLTEITNSLAVDALGPDYLGFIFYGDSPRFVPVASRAKVCGAEYNAAKVAVTVDMEIAQVSDLISEFKFAAVQLHGDESPDFCSQLKELHSEVQIWRALRVSSAADIAKAEDFNASIDALLFDTRIAGSRGGTGVAFDWRLLDTYKAQMPLFLSGGIGVESAPSARKLFDDKRSQLKIIGFDLNSRIETNPGIKSIPHFKSALNVLRGSGT